MGIGARSPEAIYRPDRWGVRFGEASATRRLSARNRELSMILDTVVALFRLKDGKGRSQRERQVEQRKVRMVIVASLVAERYNRVHERRTAGGDVAR